MSKIPPTTPQDKAMSKAHLKASIKFNEGHAKDHLKAAKKAKKLLTGSYSRMQPKNG